MAHIFKGFSTLGSSPSDGYKLYDVQLVRQDLLNHFHTRKGERVLRPDFGCGIWDLLMEPLTETVKNQILSEATRICQSDPRVTILQITPSYSEHSVSIDFVLKYNSLQNPDRFAVDFDSRQSM